MQNLHKEKPTKTQLIKLNDYKDLPLYENYNGREPDYFTVLTDKLTAEPTVKECFQEWFDQQCLLPEDLPHTMIFYGHCSIATEKMKISDPLSLVLEQLDATYGDPFKITKHENMRNSIKLSAKLLDAIKKEYVAWHCEPVCVSKIAKQQLIEMANETL